MPKPLTFTTSDIKKTREQTSIRLPKNLVAFMRAFAARKGIALNVLFSQIVDEFSSDYQ